MDGRHWTEEFFTGMGLEVVRDPDRERTAALEADFITAELGLRPGDRVLDVPCGSGRIAARLAEYGCRVVGIDSSKVMIAEARERCRDLEPPPAFRVEDVRTLREPAHYQAAIVWWGSFGYFSDEVNLAIVRALASALQPGGGMLIDTPNRERVRRYALGRHQVHFGELRIDQEIVWDHETQRIEGTWRLRRRGRSRTLRSSIRLYTPLQMAALARQAGLEQIRLLGDWMGSPYSRGGDRLVLSARRPG
jgi:SAM-dependent methyltransferase